jgi:integrase/recombinase XerD
MLQAYDAFNETMGENQNKDKQLEVLIKKQQQFERLIQSLVDSGQLKAMSINLWTGAAYA